MVDLFSVDIDVVHPCGGPSGSSARAVGVFRRKPIHIPSTAVLISDIDNLAPS